MGTEFIRVSLATRDKPHIGWAARHRCEVLGRVDGNMILVLAAERVGHHKPSIRTAARLVGPSCDAIAIRHHHLCSII